MGGGRARAMVAQVDPPTVMRRLRRIWRDAVREAVFGPAPFARAALAVFYRRDIGRLRGRFDAPFYLLQFGNDRIRRQVARAPELHYRLHGALDRLSPDPRFDLRRYLEANPGIHHKSAFLDYLSHGTPASRVETGFDANDSRPGALLLDHARGGGSTRYLDIHSGRLEQQGFRVVRARRVGQREPIFVIEAGGRCIVVRLGEDIAPIVREFRIERLVLNHLIDLPESVFHTLPAAARDLGLTYEVLLHDYYLACPRVNLIDRDGRYCGLGEPEACRLCLAGTGIEPVRWREGARALLAGADRIIAPSDDLARRLRPVFPAARITIAAPEPETFDIRIRQSRPDGDAPRIVVIGALNRPKGFDVVLGLAKATRKTCGSAAIFLMGDSIDDRALARAGVTIGGRYREADGAATLAGLRPDIILFPAIWPETWSFTLTLALRRGARVAAFDIGAIAERLRRANAGHILPYALHEDPDGLLAELLAIYRAIPVRVAA